MLKRELDRKRKEELDWKKLKLKNERKRKDRKEVGFELS